MNNILANKPNYVLLSECPPLYGGVHTYIDCTNAGALSLMMAQEVEKIYPELVATSKNTGLKSLEYGNLAAILIEAIKEQQAEIEFLKAEMENLKK